MYNAIDYCKKRKVKPAEENFTHSLNYSLYEILVLPSSVESKIIYLSTF